MDKIIIQNGNNFHQFTNDRPISIGRGYDNDLITNDPHLGKTQLSINLNAEDTNSWVLENHDPTNPVLINKKEVTTATAVIVSGDDIIAGRSHFKIYAPDHSVEPTRAFTFTNWLHAHKFKPLISLSIVAAVLLMSVIFDALSLSKEINWGNLVSNNTYPIILVFIWAASWSLIGKLQRQHHYFFSHLFFAAGLLGLSLCLENVNEYFIYFIPNMLINEILSWVTVIICFGLAIGFSLNLSSNTSNFIKKGMLSSTAIISVIFLSSYLDNPEFSNNPNFVITLKPPYAPKHSTVIAKDHIENYQDIFKQLDKLTNAQQLKK